MITTEQAARDMVVRLYGTSQPIIASLNNPGYMGQWVFFIGEPGLSKPVTVFQDGSVNGPEISEEWADAQITGTEENSMCNRNGCNGKMQTQPIHNCSCHINPPCGACTDAKLSCSKCYFTNL